MDMELSAADIAFREEVRTFLEENLPAEIKQKNARGDRIGKELTTQWQRILYDKGWVAPNWPKEYGGTGWDHMQKFIYAEEYQRAGCPTLSGFGLTMVGPVIYTFGTPEQKAEHLDKTLKGERWWCQGYSEPGAGSDLASLQTKAVRDGDEYVVNGQKIWTSAAHLADWIFVLVRTDPNAAKKQEGISFILMDIKTPGLTIKPIISIDGRHHLNETFFDDARVPIANRIGEENKGWTYAKYLLGHERVGNAQVPVHRKTIRRIKDIANQERADGTTLMQDKTFKRKVAEAEIQLSALEMSNLRMQANISAGNSPGNASSTIKIGGTTLQQELNELLVQALGYYGMPYTREQFKPDWNEPPVGPEYTKNIMADRLLRRAASIYGGSNEIQRNIIAKRILEL